MGLILGLVGGAAAFLAAYALADLVGQIRAAAVLRRALQAVVAGEEVPAIDVPLPPHWRLLASDLADAGRALGRERAEARDEIRRRDAVLDHLVDGVVLVTGRRRIAFMNRAAEAYLGVELERVRGRFHLEALRNPALDQALARAMEGSEAGRVEFETLLPPERYLEAQVVPVAGADPAALVILRDVSERRELRRMRADFVANVSHELGTPLASVRGFAETLLAGALEDPGRARRFVELILSEAERLSKLVSDLLDLSQLESGQLSLHLGEVQLEEVIRGVARRMRPRFEEAGIALELRPDPGLPPARADEGRLEQVLYNLLDNAVKFTPRGGEVVVELAAAGPDLEVRVRDTGPGLDEAERKRVFERFYRADRGRARDAGGSGLGLAIVRHIVEAHGGRVGVDPAPGGGAAFWFTVPRWSPPAI